MQPEPVSTPPKSKPKAKEPTVSAAGTLNAERVLKKLLQYIFVAVTIFLLYKISVTGYDKKIAYDTVRRESACPTLLSISRSARDTLLVMKAEMLCTEYVLNNIE